MSVGIPPGAIRLIKEFGAATRACSQATDLMARPGGFEPPASRLEVSCSIQLS
jgi:hypothetical protein